MLKKKSIQRSHVIMYKRKVDVNYKVLKGVSPNEIAQSLEEADYEAGQGPVTSPLLQQLCPHQPARRLALIESPLCDPHWAWAFIVTVRAYSPETP